MECANLQVCILGAVGECEVDRKAGFVTLFREAYWGILGMDKAFVVNLQVPCLPGQKSTRALLKAQAINTSFVWFCNYALINWLLLTRSSDKLLWNLSWRFKFQQLWLLQQIWTIPDLLVHLIELQEVETFWNMIMCELKVWPVVNFVQCNIIFFVNYVSLYCKPVWKIMCVFFA